MKDKEAREDILNCTEQIQAIGMQLKDISIKDCPKCKHLVVALRQDSRPAKPKQNLYPELLPLLKCYQCLTCGVKFICTNECICKEIDG